MPLGRAARAVLITAIAGIVLLLIGGHAAAHSGTQSYVYLEIFETEIAGRVEFPVQDLNDVLGLDLAQDEETALPQVEPILEMLQAYALDHLELGDGTEVWPVVFDGFHFLEIPDPGSYVVLDFTVDRAFTEAQRTFVATYDGIIHEKTDRDALLIIAQDWGSGTFNNEADELLRFTDGDITKEVDLGDTSFWRGFAAVVELGVDHIRIGTDHILFVIALVLPAALVFRRDEGWEPAPTFLSSLWRILKIVSLFTIAHSITLIIGGLGIFELPSRLVETIIAISIALAALHNIRPKFLNKEWLIAFAFGLFHGFGFAGLLSDLGLTQERRFVSLLGFNIGIELGQAVVILLIFPGLYLLRRVRFFVPLMYAASIVLALIAMAWAIERAFNVDLNVSGGVEAAVAWPRVLWLVIVLTIIAAGIAYNERRADRLLPVRAE